MTYPGRIIKIGEADAAIVQAIRAQLAARGFPPPRGSVGFDEGLKSLIKLFQAQNVDVNRRPLKIDGEVGPNSWGALFGAPRVRPATASIATAALDVAIAEIGVMESPPGSNRGPRVDQFQVAAGLGGGGFFWCMAFVFWCFREAGQNSGSANPFPRTAGCLDAWNRVKVQSPSKLISRTRAIANPALVKPGAVFILDFGQGHGHTGFVRRNKGGSLITVEGNSNPSGSRNGLGVFELNRRSVTNEQLRGFIDFT